MEIQKYGASQTRRHYSNIRIRQTTHSPEYNEKADEKRRNPEGPKRLLSFRDQEILRNKSSRDLMHTKDRGKALQ